MESCSEPRAQPWFHLQVKDQGGRPSTLIAGQRLTWDHTGGQDLGGPVSASQAGSFPTEPVALLGSHGDPPSLTDVTMALGLK